MIAITDHTDHHETVSYWASAEFFSNSYSFGSQKISFTRDQPITNQSHNCNWIMCYSHNNKTFLWSMIVSTTFSCGVIFHNSIFPTIKRNKRQTDGRGNHSVSTYSLSFCLSLSRTLSLSLVIWTRGFTIWFIYSLQTRSLAIKLITDNSLKWIYNYF